jgi:hypothetical protein
MSGWEFWARIRCIIQLVHVSFITCVCETVRIGGRIELSEVAWMVLGYAR